MPVRRRRKYRVVLEEHARERWVERAKREPGDLADLLMALLLDQLHGEGLYVYRGQVLLPLDKDLLDIPRSLVACIELPDLHGIWRVVTFKPGKDKSKNKPVGL